MKERECPMEKINLAEKFALFDEQWTPKIVGDLNDSYLLLAKVQGEFIWHRHEEEDELFLVIKGRLQLQLRDRTIWLDAGECYIVPRGVEHLPRAEEETWVVLLEPKSTKHTGNVLNERTVTKYERL